MINLILMSKDNFNVLLVKPNNIENHDWVQPDYIKNVLDEAYCTFHKVEPEESLFLKKLADLLEFKNFNKPTIETHVIAIEKDYVYEIVYMKFNPSNEDISNIKPNGVGILFDQQGDDIFNNVIFQKLRKPLDGSECYYEDITIKDLENIMRKRLWTSVVIYDDDEYREEEITGPIDVFGEIFFEEEYSRIKLKEISFLKHNINIWYLEDKDYGTLDITGKLIEGNPKIFKCVFFTSITNDRRDNLTNEELQKIIPLSYKLENFNLNIDENDIESLKKNKFEILWEYYDKYCNESNINLEV